jgi:hypothetical protein
MRRYIAHNNTDSTVTVMETVADHKHEYATLEKLPRGSLMETTKVEIQKLFSSGVRYESQIVYALRDITNKDNVQNR